jgi:hypothetical protein
LKRDVSVDPEDSWVHSIDGDAQVAQAPFAVVEEKEEKTS